MTNVSSKHFETAAVLEVNNKQVMSKGSCDLQYKMPVARATTCHEVLSHANHNVPTLIRTLLNSKARYGFCASQQAQKPPEHTMPAVEQSLNLTHALASLLLS